MQNIRNYVNNEDFVTGVPLEEWGYLRYGITENFTSTDYRTNPRFASAYLALGKLGMKIDKKAGKNALVNFGKAAGSVYEYYNKGDNTLFDLCYIWIAHAAIGVAIDKGEMLVNHKNKPLILWFFGVHKNTTIPYSHMPETYYAYLSQVGA